MSGPHLLVVAKAPVAGRVKTRLGTDIGMDAAADIAAAALLDTLEACTSYAGPSRCHLSLDGDLAAAVRADELVRAATGWTIRPQRGDDFGTRLAQAHADLATGPVLQVGMDTPQLTPGLLAEVAAGLAEHEAVLGPAADGGWWVLALRDPRHASALTDVPMSTATTGADTRAALAALGLSVGAGPELRDVDTVTDADAVAAGAPDGRFAAAWSARSERPAGTAVLR
ncbi:TIGR04282 family arsenosugar biosynthesis glycosyltransferase [Nocardioides lianchengensis]|uniref:Uncharacterized protein n=1 Tax=Nocardioides lianchengensis TaxID=1045774 RepID=A0A1G6XC76_9ACTN|nr:DUF2064 domain-containing protein [Nocardioides lianchengensis]NYG09019.1 hypothetical protein [Nocardioides lianchengensis]SDD75672.1 hypothetical protein SAMN05421872_110240 [Nocardioides lianchengensis]